MKFHLHFTATRVKVLTKITLSRSVSCTALNNQHSCCVILMVMLFVRDSTGCCITCWKMLLKDQKHNWPVHMNALVFTYNVMPHATTEYQPYNSCLDPRPRHHVITGWDCPSMIVASLCPGVLG